MHAGMQCSSGVTLTPLILTFTLIVTFTPP